MRNLWQVSNHGFEDQKGCQWETLQWPVWKWSCAIPILNKVKVNFVRKVMKNFKKVTNSKLIEELDFGSLQLFF